MLGVIYMLIHIIYVLIQYDVCILSAVCCVVSRISIAQAKQVRSGTRAGFIRACLHLPLECYPTSLALSGRQQAIGSLYRQYIYIYMYLCTFIYIYIYYRLLGGPTLFPGPILCPGTTLFPGPTLFSDPTLFPGRIRAYAPSMCWAL